MRGRRVAIVTNIPTPYRKGFFAALASLPDIDLTVFYCAPVERGRSWGAQAGYGYAYRFLNGVTLGTSFHINPTLPMELARGKFETVVVGGYSYPSAIMALSTSRILGSRVVMWLDGPVGFKASLLKRMFLGLADHYIVASTKARESLIRLGIRPQVIDVVPLTVDVSAWGGSHPRLPAHLDSVFAEKQMGRFILFCGRFIPVKNIDFVIELAARMKDLQDVTFLLVGDGPLRGILQQKVQERGLSNIVFLGFIPPEQLPPVFAMSEILLLPSLRESWGAVVNEALAAGIPVMVSSVAGAADLVEHGKNGYIIDPHDIDRAEVLLRGYLADDGLRQDMKGRAKITSARLSHEFAAELFARVIQGRSVSRDREGRHA